MHFSRTEEYQADLILEAVCHDKAIYQDVKVIIKRDPVVDKLRAYCPIVDGYLLFPENLRHSGVEYTADIVEVIPSKEIFRVVKNSIRRLGSNQICG